MAAQHSKYLKPLYNRENPLRALGQEANRIEREEQSPSVVRCNVGDPTGPTFAPANWAMSQYYLTRPRDPGYTDHTGEPGLRSATAEILTKLNRLPEGTFDADKIFCVAGGTGGLNTALAIFNDHGTQVFVTDPFYPPWGPITERNNLDMIRFPLRAEENYLLNGRTLRKMLQEVDPNRPLVLMYHYPHNPTGKALTQQEAEHVARTLNKLMKDFPNLYLVQEDLYLATTRSDLGIYTPMPYLTPDALERTILVHSPSKEGHGQDRGAIVATPSAEMAKRLRGSTAFSTLGTSTGAFVGTVRTLHEIADGIDPKTEANANNYRYSNADYYQDRMKAIAKGFIDLENYMGVKILDQGIPEGTYYLWPKLGFLKGLPVPDALQTRIYDASGDSLGSTPSTIESAHDIMDVLSHAHRIGLLPVMVTPGEFFTDNNDELRIRMAAVDRNPEKLAEVANTIKGVVGTIMGLDLNALGVTTHSIDSLRQKFPPGQPASDFDIVALTMPSRDATDGRLDSKPEEPPLG